MYTGEGNISKYCYKAVRIVLEESFSFEQGKGSFQATNWAFLHLCRAFVDKSRLIS